MPKSKEELAAALRDMLGVKVKFEKLSREEIIELIAAVEKLVGEAEGEEAGDKGPLGLGILPMIREQVRKIIPEIRAELRRTIDETFTSMRGKPRKR